MTLIASTLKILHGLNDCQVWYFPFTLHCHPKKKKKSIYLPTRVCHWMSLWKKTSVFLGHEKYTYSNISYLKWHKLQRLVKIRFPLKYKALKVFPDLPRNENPSGYWYIQMLLFYAIKLVSLRCILSKWIFVYSTREMRTKHITTSSEFGIWPKWGSGAFIFLLSILYLKRGHSDLIGYTKMLKSTWCKLVYDLNATVCLLIFSSYYIFTSTFKFNATNVFLLNRNCLQLDGSHDFHETNVELIELLSICICPIHIFRKHLVCPT